MRKIIAITGKAGAGKSTVSRMCAVLVDGSIGHAAFASGVRMKARKDFGWDGKKDLKGRKLLQRVGEAHRNIDPDYWVNQVKGALVQGAYILLQAGADIIDHTFIDDLRYPNEATMVVDEMDGIIIRVVSSLRGATMDEESSAHPSETAMDEVEVDFTIENDYQSLTELFNEVQRLWPAIEAKINERKEAGEEARATFPGQPFLAPPQARKTHDPHTSAAEDPMYQ